MGFTPFKVVCGIISHGPLGLSTASDKTRLHGQTIDFVEDLQLIHYEAQHHLESTASSYKLATDEHKRKVNFAPKDLVWVVLTNDRFHAHEYNKLKSRETEPMEIICRINANAYQLRLPNHLHTSDVFNVKHLYHSNGENAYLYSGKNVFLPREI